MRPPPTDETDETRPGETSGVFPVVDFAEVDVDRLVARAIRTVSNDGGVSARIHAAQGQGSAIVFGVRDKLEAAVTRVLQACVHTTVPGTPLRVALRKQGIHWSIRIHHCFTRQDGSLDSELEASLAFARAVLIGHDGMLDVATDLARRTRVIALSIRAEGES